MAKKTTKSRSWTKEDIRILKTMVREKTKTTVIARKLKRSAGATRQKAAALGVNYQERLIGSKGMTAEFCASSSIGAKPDPARRFTSRTSPFSTTSSSSAAA